MGTQDASINQELIDNFCEYMAKGLLKRSEEPATDAWPQPVFNPFVGNYFASKEFLTQLYRIFYESDVKNLLREDLANKFRYPSRIAQLMYLFMEDSINNDEAIKKTMVASKLLSIIELLRRSNTFCNNGENTLLNQRQFIALINNLKLKNINILSDLAAIRRTIAEIIIALSSYCEFLYFAHTRFGREFHGPYNGPLGIALIRDYFDLRPSFWHFAKNFPFKNIRIVTIYPENINIQLDFAGRLLTDEALGPKLKCAAIIIDDNEVQLEVDELQVILNLINNSLKDAVEEISQTNKEELIAKWVEGYFWVLHPLREYLGESWKPSQKLYLEIKQDKTDTWLIRVMRKISDYPYDFKLEILKNIFDPRLINKRNKILKLIADETE